MSTFTFRTVAKLQLAKHADHDQKDHGKKGGGTPNNPSGAPVMTATIRDGYGDVESAANVTTTAEAQAFYREHGVDFNDVGEGSGDSFEYTRSNKDTKYRPAFGMNAAEYQSAKDTLNGLLSSKSGIPIMQRNERIKRSGGYVNETAGEALPTAFKGRKEETAARKKAGSAIIDATSGNNVYHDAIPNGTIGDILTAHGFNEEGLDGIYTGADGRTNAQVGPNSWLTMSWHKMPSGRYEITAYMG